MIIMASFYLVLLIIPYIFYELDVHKSKKYGDIGEKYVKNLMKCFKQPISGYDLPNSFHPAWKCLGDCVSLSMLYGFFIGFIV